MGVITQQSIKGALANYLGIIIGFFTTFFVLTDCLSQSEIGLTRVMVDAAMLFSGLAQLGTNSSIVRFYPYFKHESSGDHGFFAWTLLLPFLGFSVFLALFFLLKGVIVHVYSANSPLFVDYIYWLLPLTFFSLYLTVFETNASVLLRITVPKMVREIGIRLFNLIAYLLYGHNIISLDLFVALFCGSYGLATLLNFLYLLSLKKVSFKIDLAFLDRRMVREVLTYTFYMTMTVLAGNIPLINSLFLGAKGGLALAGIYTIASYIANVIEVPYRSLGAISQPLISQAVKEGDIHEVNRLGQQVSLHQMLVASLLFFFIWINLKALFSIIPNGEEFISGIGVVFWLGLTKIINSSFSIGTSILNYSKHYMMTLPLIILLTLSAVFFNYYLIPLWGINGSACATLFSYLLYFSLLLLYLRHRLQVRLLCHKQSVTICFVAVLMLLDSLWNHFLWIGPTDQLLPVAANSIVKSLVFLVVALVALYRLQISPNVNQILNKMLSIAKRSLRLH